VAIVGAGPVGASVARALAPVGLSVALVESRPPGSIPTAGFDQRVYALNRQSRCFLERCDVWQHLSPARIAPVLEMRVFGDDASEIQFSAYRNGVPELAVIVEEANLQQALRASLAAQSDLLLMSGVTCTGAQWEGERVALSMSDGNLIQAQLVVAADGAESALRTAAGIAVRVHEYGQTGVVANFRSGQPHRDTAYQWFMHDGVLALLPLPGNQVSMVWSTSSARAQLLLSADAKELSRQVGEASDHLLGGLELVGNTAGFALRRMRAERLIAPRLALVGDTAHNVHPLAGQGLNLGFGDVQALIDVLALRGLQSDSGAYALLRRYERSRREAVLAMEAVTDGLHGLFDSKLPGMKRLRNTGLRLVNRNSALKRVLVKRALG
ncbi:MAG: FAD-dependent monooxygenase, partial [Betaproteobacteria bacterium]